MDLAKRPALDRVDQRPHSLVQLCRQLDVIGRTLPALGDMGRRPAFAQIDDRARKQRIALGGKTLGLGQRLELADQPDVEMRLGPVEMDPADIERQPRQPIGLGGEQGIEPRHIVAVDRGPRAVFRGG